MYLSHYNLDRKPFQLTTDPRFLWLGEKHKEALATLKYGVVDQKGFLLITGDVGTGKTTLINALLEDLQDDTLVANITNPSLDLMDFLNFIAISFNISRKFDNKLDFIVYFSHFLKKIYSDNKNVLLIIDEAHSLSKELLENIRLLSNIELPEEKLINIFLVGQNEINQTLASQECRALRQRIMLIYQIKPLSEKETFEYIKYRLKVAGTEIELFNQKAIQEVYLFSNGYPRLINVICDQALLTGYARNLKKITETIIKECSQELSLPGETKKNKLLDFSEQYDNKTNNTTPTMSYHINLPQNSKSKTQKPLVLKLAMESLSQKNYDRSVIFFENIIARNTVNIPELKMYYSQALRGQARRLLEKNPSEAEILLLKAIEADPKNAKAYFDLGKFYTKSKDYSKAIISYQKAADLRYRLPDIFFNLGFVYAATKDFENSEKMFLLVAKLRPSYIDKVLFNQALVQQKQGKRNQCIENLQKALIINPKNQKVQKYLNRFKGSLGVPAD
jgi:type II secretory pathway predicted ATPase ExeA